ncbi:hypothetical protein [Carboxylicivirga linearis]|uniref:Aspartyl protease n=1 Tax=Carboxylicivirga linearis TaxID=1628157 RepID=A0ABS5JRP8_9BACT|nr:hypothetical protein [Carboxylicivirga linearis]MBS2097076.1 hypothetical protein [Carboxylicivirga linearis]
MSAKKIFIFLIVSLLFSSTYAKVTEIPYTQLPTGQLVVELTIDGIDLPQLFIVETSGGNFLRSDMNYRLSTLGLDTLKKGYKFAHIKMGDRTIEKVKFETKNKLGKRSEYSFPNAVLGTIGSQLFKDLSVQFDFQKKVIRIADTKEELNIPEGTNYIPFSQSFLNHIPIIEIQPWQYMTQRLEVEVSVPLGIVLAWNGPALEVRYRNNTNMQSYKVKLDDVKTITITEQFVKTIDFDHSFSIYNAPITFSDDVKPLLGYQFLNQFLVTFDYDKGKLYLDPQTKEAKALFESEKK